MNARSLSGEAPEAAAPADTGTPLVFRSAETSVSHATKPAVATPQISPSHPIEHLDHVLQRVSEAIAPVWPLKDYVATNPYAGLAERPFVEARSFLRIFSNCELLMPMGHYAEQFSAGKLAEADIDQAIDELQHIHPDLAISSVEVTALMNGCRVIPSDAGNIPASADRRIEALTEYWDRDHDDEWTDIVRDEISKHCAAHYDQGQAMWKSPWKHLPLYQAWREAAADDRNVEILGLSGFRRYVQQLPHTAEAAIEHSLGVLGVPPHLWEAVLLCQAFTIPGWSAWAKYQHEMQTSNGGGRNDLVGLLAIRLAYDAVLGEAFSFEVDWDSVGEPESASFASKLDGEDKELLARYVLLRASEIAFSRPLLESLATSAVRPEAPQKASGEEAATSTKKLAQMVFCIDVRSEPFRRQLEACSEQIETFGFAGFFGMPLEFVPLGMQQGDDHVPVLLKPEFQLHEGLHEKDAQHCESKVLQVRGRIRRMRKLWKEFQTSAVGCFSFVETTGLAYGLKLLSRVTGITSPGLDPRFDGVPRSERQKLGPTLRGLNHQGITTSRQVELAESVLKNLGLTDQFARLVVFCGHSSQTDNNPLAAGLDCGACGGHSGEPNARLAAMLLNQSYVRKSLADKGIKIPDETVFLAGLHNTTTDELQFFDLDELPPSHREDVAELLEHSQAASEHARRKRMTSVGSKSPRDLFRRSADWSEVRPEWGLAGNAAFIVGPRELTRDIALEGRAFLHSYDHAKDPEGDVLEGIMTAPMVVAHLINMQYYASAVDNRHFGSGNKTVHNVVGGFGLLSGNGGDLMTGLPWQSLHTGSEYQHLPLRLQAMIAAPREAIQKVIEKHEAIEKLLTNGWLHLVAIEDGTNYRYGEDGGWHAV